MVGSTPTWPPCVERSLLPPAIPYSRGVAIGIPADRVYGCPRFPGQGRSRSRLAAMRDWPPWGWPLLRPPPRCEGRVAVTEIPAVGHTPQGCIPRVGSGSFHRRDRADRRLLPVITLLRPLGHHPKAHDWPAPGGASQDRRREGCRQALTHQEGTDAMESDTFRKGSQNAWALA